MKTILSKLNPSLVEMLPRGSVSILAERYDLHRNSVTQMLKGKLGREDNIRKLVRDALAMIEAEISEVSQKETFVLQLRSTMQLQSA